MVIKFMRKYYMELIAALIVAAFWTTVWGYHAYKTAQYNHLQQTHTYNYTPGIDQ